MFCKHCGSKVEGHHAFCPTCGQKLDAPFQAKSRFPLLKLLIGIPLIGGIIALYLLFNQEDPKKTVEEQLNALKGNQLTEAYYGYTSKEFQKSTSLEKFKEVIRHFSSLSHVTEMEVTDEKYEDDQATLVVVLKTLSNETFKMEYELTKEDGQWKIIFFKLLNDSNKPTVKQEVPAAAQVDNRLTPKDIIQDQLDDFKKGKIKESYDAYASNEFKEATPLNNFVSFVNSNKILNEFTDYKIINREDLNDIQKIDLQLTSPSEKKNLEFTFLNENGDWKIRGILLTPPKEKKTFKPAEPLDAGQFVKRIESFLALLKSGSFDKAYNENTSSNFKQFTTLEQFTSEMEQHPSFYDNKNIKLQNVDFSDDIGAITTLLTDSQGKNESAQFDFSEEKGEWKIQQIQIFQNSEKQITFTSIVVGTEKNDLGEITNPAVKFKNPPRELFVNIYIHNAMKGEKIEATLINEKLKIKSPAIEHTIILTTSDYLAMFSFEAPENGWPPGEYEVIAESGNGQEMRYPFIIL